jgi:DNA helicase-2/ATP-dependent DNA helicase PcrA
MQLDIQQEAAVITDSDRALVLAGAGSGKTRTLIERISYLIEQKKVSPYEILAFTFTRKAAGEMQSRLEERIGAQAHAVTMGTMHAIALNFLHRFGETIGLKPRAITVYSQWESDYLLKEIAIEMGIYKKSWKPAKTVITEAFETYYQQGVEPDASHPGKAIFNVFMSRCKENNALTYGGLLVGLELLIPFIAKHTNYRYILVDEVQDIDLLQWHIIESMLENFNAKLFAVGDVDQSIYEWRGAVPQYLIDHAHLFDIFRIETNYRSQVDIVDAANNLIRNNSYRLKKTMLPMRKAHGEIDVIPDMASGNLASFIFDFLGEEVNAPSPTAVLCRVHGPLKKLSSILNDLGIKHHYVGKQTALTNSEEFRRFHAFLKLMVNPYDNFSFLLVKDKLEIPLQKYQELRLTAAKTGASHFNAFQYDQKTSFFTYAIEDVSTPPGEIPAHQEWEFGLIVNTIAAEFEWPEGQDTIVDFISSWHEKNTAGTIRQYLDWLATYDLQEEVKENEGLQLMTIHAAKGLEWPTVIVAGANEGLLPSTQAIKSGDIEAERRLAYVAWTRAEDQLVLAVRPQSSETNGKTKLTPISRFIKESQL